VRVILVACTTLVEDVPDYKVHNNTMACDELAEEAGRLCYLSWDRPNPDTADNRSYLSNIIKQQHFSVVEHASATFYIDGVTRNFTHELIRHRHLSFSEISQRYVDVGNLPFIRHPGLSDKDDVELDAIISQNRDLYYRYIEEGLNEGLARKLVRQAARHVLPSGLETKILVTGNMRAWREVLSKRLSPMADAEFREVAALILQNLKKIAPGTFQDF
jgi:thymidylate synthase (FAD)